MERLKSILALKLLGVSDRKITLLSEDAQDISAVFDYSPEVLSEKYKLLPQYVEAITKFSRWKDIDLHIQKASDQGIVILEWRDSRYPPSLRSIKNYPTILWVKGNLQTLKKRTIALVGSRNHTKYGAFYMDKYARFFAQQDMVIVSGLALGLDAIAHQVAVKLEKETIAVIASGIDHIYPPEHKRFINDILKFGGVLLSTYPMNSKVETYHFPYRNSVIAGISLATVVIESAIVGGSIITADHAYQIGRSIFAIPHSLDNKRGMGCNMLIHNGKAKITIDPEDVLQELGIKKRHINDGSPKRWESATLIDIEKMICECLIQGELQIDELSERMDMSIQDISIHLLNLQMKKCIKRSSGNSIYLL